jgi:D-sedoheptulose 7-phosphate isomerase
MEYINQAIQETQQILSLFSTLESEIIKAANKMKDLLNDGKKILLIGNGGSAADAQHFAAELMVRFSKDRRPFPAIALTTDSSILTAHSNDYNFNTIFKRQIEALGKSNDCLVALSTSGNSTNIIEATKFAREKKIIVIGLTGATGGKMKKFCDICIQVPSNNIARIQEIHILIIHILCDLLENIE